MSYNLENQQIVSAGLEIISKIPFFGFPSNSPLPNKTTGGSPVYHI